MGWFERLAEEAKRRLQEHEKASALAKQKPIPEVRRVEPWEVLEEKARRLMTDAWNGKGEVWNDWENVPLPSEARCFDQRLRMTHVHSKYKTSRKQYGRLMDLGGVQANFEARADDRYERGSPEQQKRLELTLLEQEMQLAAAQFRGEFPYAAAPKARPLLGNEQNAIRQVFFYWHLLFDDPSEQDQLMLLGKASKKKEAELAGFIEGLFKELGGTNQFPDASFSLAYLAQQRATQLRSYLRFKQAKNPSEESVLKKAGQLFPPTVIEGKMSENLTKDRQSFLRHVVPVLIKDLKPEEIRTLSNTHEQLVIAFFEYAIDKQDLPLAAEVFGQADLWNENVRRSYRTLLIRALAQAKASEVKADQRKKTASVDGTYRQYSQSDVSETAAYWQQFLEEDPVAAMEATARAAAVLDPNVAIPWLEAVEREWFAQYEAKPRVHAPLNEEAAERSVREQTNDLMGCYVRIQLARARVEPQQVNFAQLELLRGKLRANLPPSLEDIDLSVDRFEAAFLLFQQAEKMKNPAPPQEK